MGLAEAISAEADLEVCGEADGWHDAIIVAREQRPDLVVLDLNLKDGSGWDMLKQMDPALGPPPVLVLSVCDEEIYAARLIKSGAMGYLMKDEPIQRVLEAMRKVLAGHIAVSDSIATSLIQTSTLRSGQTSEMGGLSNRELQVFELLKQRLTNKEIASRLNISQKTVGTYKARLMEKFGARTTLELLEHLAITTE